MNTEINIGIDTSQSQLDIFVRPLDVFFSVKNTPQGVTEAVNQLRSYNPKRVQAPIRRIHKSIQKELEDTDQRLDKLIDAVPEWRATRDLLLSAKGVGKVLAYTLMSE